MKTNKRSGTIAGVAARRSISHARSVFFSVLFVVCSSFLPTITIGQFPQLEVGVTTDIVLYFKNPVERGMKLWLTLPGDSAAGAGVAATPAPAAAAATQRPSSSQPPSQLQAPVLVRDASASVDFVRGSTLLAAYDDLPEENAAWVEPSSAAALEPLPDLVVFRHLSKVGLLLHVTPRSSQLSTHFILHVNFQMESPNTSSSSSSSSSLGASVDPAASTPAATSPAPSPSPSPPAAAITTFPLHVNLGFAIAKQEARS